MVKSELILGLDIGTSSVRAALYDVEGNMLPKTLVQNERLLEATDDGGAEIDADEAFEQILQAIDDVFKKSSRIPGQIICIAASSFWHSLVGVDAKGRPTTKVFGWADTRSREQTQILRKELDEAGTHNRTGARFHSSFWPTKLLWLQKDFHKVWCKTDRWLSFSDYAALKLFGVPATSISMASGTGIFDIRKCEWDAPLMKFLNIKPSNLPDIGRRKPFRIGGKFAERWPRLKEAEWFPAIGDGAANNIGAGCVKKTEAALMIGTSGAMRVAYAGEPPKRVPAGLWCYRIDEKRVIIGGALSDGGGLYRWLTDTLRLDSDDEAIETEIVKRAPAGHDLIFLPFLAGERSVGYHENARGAVIGLKTATDSVDIVQAALESVAYRFSEIFDQLKDVCKIRDIVASGGALRQSPVWTQMISDVLGHDLTFPQTREASMRGAVLLVLETIGKIGSIEEIEKPKGTEFQVNRSRKPLYLRAKKRHQAFYEQLIDITD